MFLRPTLLINLIFCLSTSDLPHDMEGLQVSLYCMTRLLAETNPSLYRHLDRLEADPSLYATPWFLTLFAANFPLGFVARVMDMIILEASVAPVIKIGVCLLLEMEARIGSCSNLEELMVVMKEKLPNLSSDRLEDVIRQASSLNINRYMINILDGLYPYTFQAA